MDARWTRVAGLVGVLGLLGCPSAPQAVRETVVRTPVASPRSLAPVVDRSPAATPKPVPYYPGITGDGQASADPEATGTGPVAARLQLGPECKPTSLPSDGPSPSFTYAGKGLYAGPFPLSATGAVIHVEHEPDGAPGTFVLHLDADDQREKNLVVDAAGRVRTTFKFPGRGGAYAFYLQMDPPGPWAVDVYNLPASPTPTPKTSPTPTAKTSPTPTPTATATATTKP